MVHPKAFLDLNRDELAAIYQHAQELVRALSRTYWASGFNVFQNNGVSAGQSAPHFHLHIVPRYQGEDPGQVFREQQFEIISLEEHLTIAAEIKKHLGKGVA